VHSSRNDRRLSKVHSGARDGFHLLIHFKEALRKPPEIVNRFVQERGERNDAVLRVASWRIRFKGFFEKATTLRFRHQRSVSDR
jgi:hypothetical protein